MEIGAATLVDPSQALPGRSQEMPVAGTTIGAFAYQLVRDEPAKRVDRLVTELDAARPVSPQPTDG